MSAFIHPHVFPNVYDFILWNTKEDILRFLLLFFFVHTMEINGFYCLIEQSDSSARVDKILSQDCASEQTN